MTITRINQFEARASMEGKLHDLLRSVIAIIETRPGCISLRLLRGTENPAHLAIVEEWESIAAHQGAARAIPAETMAEATALFARPPSGTYYEA